MIRFSCSQCGQAMEAPEEHAGKQALCPRCRQQFQIPMPQPLPTAIPVDDETRQQKPRVSRPKWVYGAAGAVVLVVLGLVLWAVAGRDGEDATAGLLEDPDAPRATPVAQTEPKAPQNSATPATPTTPPVPVKEAPTPEPPSPPAPPPPGVALKKGARLTAGPWSVEIEAVSRAKKPDFPGIEESSYLAFARPPNGQDVVVVTCLVRFDATGETRQGEFVTSALKALVGSSAMEPAFVRGEATRFSSERRGTYRATVLGKRMALRVHMSAAQRAGTTSHQQGDATVTQLWHEYVPDPKSTPAGAQVIASVGRGETTMSRTPPLDPWRIGLGFFAPVGAALDGMRLRLDLKAPDPEEQTEAPKAPPTTGEREARAEPAPPCLSAEHAKLMHAVVVAQMRKVMGHKAPCFKTIRKGTALDAALNGRQYRGEAAGTISTFRVKPGEVKFQSKKFAIRTTNAWHLSQDLVIPAGSVVTCERGTYRVSPPGTAPAPPANSPKAQESKPTAEAKETSAEGLAVSLESVNIEGADQGSGWAKRYVRVVLSLSNPVGPEQRLKLRIPRDCSWQRDGGRPEQAVGLFFEIPRRSKAVGLVYKGTRIQFVVAERRRRPGSDRWQKIPSREQTQGQAVVRGAVGTRIPKGQKCRLIVFFPLPKDLSDRVLKVKGLKPVEVRLGG